ncbi:FAD:protein FMN transferase [Companilactobacillus sp.]|jgi:thiamine biosynthesis lipoprotein|uniref:FAD:protein FMN transferase n=1 Tax=Companilactobacillus sp. TaxID=2767905 RepID=UPI0025BF3D6E|nr:FAD:protein FMN transferase [Companilactobacillus sp.]MCH4009742.1 FAD:protein FMN transferase [Companilactobacillus sp.]MCH4052582.1 FAD:protein FMN transferase [Companilactobacillus sp.]MCH4077684.1 FAD:protein FMN transferase [Companilactobacillus sp.]MCH4126260.1 FAD:protein FMN transferase [Companilactobacillus sp.]MCI1311968.1 FAD:protein FMN transferase [Companilactobacillus sp.]
MGMINKKYYALGTVINLSVAPPATEKDLDSAYQLIQHYEDKLTVNRAESEVMSVNHNAGIKAVSVPEDTYDLIKKAVVVSQRHLGFNVAIGPLVKLWKIGFKGANKPADSDIRQRLTEIDPFQIELNDSDQSVFLKKTGMEIDLGGIAKGWIADRIKELWEKSGVKSGIIDLGGNILLVGKSLRPDSQWRIGIQNPVEKRNVPLGVLQTAAKSIGTSGIYERKLVIYGHSYHHMFDSLTGYPIDNNLASVTIISDRSVDGEIWSTIGFYQGMKKGLALLETEPGIEAIFITRDLEVKTTSGLKNTFSVVG